ncbi:uncharacterized protein TNCV_3094461 [Trichonephila clavipes]|nr:uncharacterized protein TNCV_3094461 [Trichonephila clavipes]
MYAPQQKKWLSTPALTGFPVHRTGYRKLATIAAAVLVVIEVVVNSVEYEEQYLTDRHPKGAVWSYGYSFVFAWLTFVVLLIIGITFMICSRKKKGDRSGGGQVDDEPHILGRM